MGQPLALAQSRSLGIRSGFRPQCTGQLSLDWSARLASTWRQISHCLGCVLRLVLVRSVFILLPASYGGPANFSSRLNQAADTWNGSGQLEFMNDWSVPTLSNPRNPIPLKHALLGPTSLEKKVSNPEAGSTFASNKHYIVLTPFGRQQLCELVTSLGCILLIRP